MKHYTIKINNSEKKNTGIYNFRNTNNPSKSLDDLILSNIIKTNPYLGGFYGYTTKKDNDRITISNRNYSSILKDDFDTEFAKAAKFLAKYNPGKNIYTFDENDITFFEDEIQIGSTLIPLYMLEDYRYYKDITPATKNIIINLFITINK